MTPEDHLAAVAHEVAAFRAGLERALTAPEGFDTAVASCLPWTVRDLTVHLGEVQRWVVHAIDHGNPDAPTPEPVDDADLVAWFARGSEELLAHLDVDPATPAWTFGPDKVVGFWQRRQVHEHRIHRWDLEDALGDASPLDPVVAHDGIDEVATMFWPRQLRLGRTEEPPDALTILTSDTDGAWTVGPGEVSAALSGTAADIALALWHRMPGDDPRLTWTGDVVRGRELLALKLTP
ncbi:MAG: maleylpyruvate isomerase family mycothiol-dependent enzyme [Nocardioidaceae bacterium]|nr:maleylpyruvate isomerase family mycothiol-dependent enzyme [Nocardioidaceae bacterium]